MVRPVDYKPKPIDPDFLEKEDEFPVSGEHDGHTVRSEGLGRLDNEGKTYPTKLGIHGTHVAVDFEACIADGVCMDVCPVDVFEWLLNPGNYGTGNDKVITDDANLYGQYRTDKSDPIREEDCIDCMACEAQCPTQAIKINIGA